MKRVLTVAIVALLCLMVAIPVATAEHAAAPSPSMTVKIVGAAMDGEPLEGCVVVTTIEEAEKKTTDIMQEERDLLLQTYEALNDGSMVLPVEGAIRELVDVSFKYEQCRQIEEHGHKDVALKEEGVVLTVQFDMGIESAEGLHVLTCIDGVWEAAEEVKCENGILTCVFEDLCPVAFVVEE